MFIPIHAKADIVGEKKGKITPAQASQLNAWCLASKTGILDWGGKCEATATSYSISNNVATIVLNKGYIVICGRLVEVEQNTSIVVDTSANPSGKIILSFNLSSSGTEEFKVEVVNRNLRQDDLNKNPISGVYEFELCRYETNSTNLTIIKTVNTYVKSVEDAIDDAENNAIKIATNYHNQAVNSIALLEGRLNSLGFRSGAISFSGVNYGSNYNTDTSTNGVFRQGNYVIGNINTKLYISTSMFQTYFADGKTLFVLPEQFRPKKELPFLFIINEVNTEEARFYNVTINTNGNAIVTVLGTSSAPSLNAKYNIRLNFGYEAPPIN